MNRNLLVFLLFLFFAVLLNSTAILAQQPPEDLSGMTEQKLKETKFNELTTAQINTITPSVIASASPNQAQQYFDANPARLSSTGLSNNEKVLIDKILSGKSSKISPDFAQNCKDCTYENIKSGVISTKFGDVDLNKYPEVEFYDGTLLYGNGKKYNVLTEVNGNVKQVIVTGPKPRIDGDILTLSTGSTANIGQRVNGKFQQKGTVMSQGSVTVDLNHNGGELIQGNFVATVLKGNSMVSVPSIDKIAKGFKTKTRIEVPPSNLCIDCQTDLGNSVSIVGQDIFANGRADLTIIRGYKDGDNTNDYAMNFVGKTPGINYKLSQDGVHLLSDAGQGFATIDIVKFIEQLPDVEKTIYENPQAFLRARGQLVHIVASATNGKLSFAKINSFILVDEQNKDVGGNINVALFNADGSEEARLMKKGKEYYQMYSGSKVIDFNNNLRAVVLGDEKNTIRIERTFHAAGSTIPLVTVGQLTMETENDITIVKFSTSMEDIGKSVTQQAPNIFVKAAATLAINKIIQDKAVPAVQKDFGEYSPQIRDMKGSVESPEIQQVLEAVAKASDDIGVIQGTQGIKKVNSIEVVLSPGANQAMHAQVNLNVDNNQVLHSNKIIIEGYTKSQFNQYVVENYEKFASSE